VIAMPAPGAPAAIARPGPEGGDAKSALQRFGASRPPVEAAVVGRVDGAAAGTVLATGAAAREDKACARAGHRDPDDPVVGDWAVLRTGPPPGLPGPAAVAGGFEDLSAAELDVLASGREAVAGVGELHGR
jgi:hypothetical protein